MLWEERRVFTVSELSKVEQGAKVWFLFGSQGTWHTKCFYKEKKKGRSGSEFSEISSFPFGCVAVVAFLGNFPFQGEVWSSLESPTSFQWNMPFGENVGLYPPCPEHQIGAWSGRTGPATGDDGICEISCIFHFFSWVGNYRHWRIGWKYVLFCSPLQEVHW